jgi:hypothetical protein
MEIDADISDVFVTIGEYSEKQWRYALWADYFSLMRKFISSQMAEQRWDLNCQNRERMAWLRLAVMDIKRIIRYLQVSDEADEEVPMPPHLGEM